MIVNRDEKTGLNWAYTKVIVVGLRFKNYLLKMVIA
jgi:hypothetical protein